ncbi:MAG: ribonuclease HI family protein [Thermoprotei archaeon]|nr:ribonuclease HI family protein [Thermoprotei archaeon]
MITVYFDGLCEPVNPGGVATYGFIVYRDHEKLYEEAGVIGVGALGDDVTNNVAEYTALIRALEWLIRNGFTEEHITVKGDSQLIIRQMQGIYSVRSPRLLLLHRRAKVLTSKFKSLKLEWVPREENAEADALSRKAYLQFMREHADLMKDRYGRYLATEEQKATLKKVGITPDPFISRWEAERIIRRLRRKAPRSNR